ncbi:hypothetical protein ABT061_27850 [Streptosporangium sp. NPDC002544]|uniref:hypothetical protein n=1 Tax=Streptosporangium sp. NPDC002544 TaxID=3154538 RepID=UPI003317EBB7
MTIEGSKADVLGVRRGRMGVYRYAYWQHTKTRARIHLCSYLLADQVATITGEGRGMEINSEIEPEDYYAHLERTHGPLRWITSVHTQMPYGETYEDLNMEPIGTPLLLVRRLMLSKEAVRWSSPRSKLLATGSKPQQSVSMTRPDQTDRSHSGCSGLRLSSLVQGSPPAAACARRAVAGRAAALRPVATSTAHAL